MTLGGGGGHRCRRMTLGMEVVVVDDAGAGCHQRLEMTLELGSLLLLLLLLWTTLGLGWRAAPLSTLELGGGRHHCQRWS